ncbi:MAG: VacJ family lipoprotein [Epsilonproteobacteria bacterium]|nr:VacJ family lipoprotein [Campylobacterota bacterium]
MLKILLSILLFTSLLISASTEDSIADSFEDEFSVQKKEDFDPLRGYNEVMTDINDKFYTYILFPVAKGYKKVVPTPARKSVSNFFHNLMFPVRLVNNLLQFKIRNSFEETQRFLLNSTIGIGGLFDVATTKFHLKEHDEDFGQTLGYYGIGSGFPIVWPILGQSNLRDSIGFVGDYLIDPKVYISQRSYNIPDDQTQSDIIGGVNIINKSSFDYKKYEAIKKGNVLLYPVIKDLYEEHRKKLISE